MAYQNICSTTEDNVAIVTLNRPARRNALSLDLMLELIHCLSEIDDDRRIRAVILAASGNVYSAGHDLSEMVGRDSQEYERLFEVCTELMLKIQSICQPVIAEVQGVATAAGCQLVATCDLAVASENASFATPGVRIGLFCTTPMVAVSRAIGRKRALEMLLTGAPVDARTAAEWGLVNRVVPESALRSETLRLASRIAEASEVVVTEGKQAFYAQLDMNQATAYAFAKKAMAMNALALNAQEGITAFLEKRQPCWTAD